MKLPILTIRYTHTKKKSKRIPKTQEAGHSNTIIHTGWMNVDGKKILYTFLFSFIFLDLLETMLGKSTT